MKRKMIYATAALLLLSGLSGCDNSKGKVSLGVFTTKDILVNDFTDPRIPGVTCHVAHIKADLSLADPSNMSIACRQTGEILPEQIAGLDESKNGEVVFKESKSVLFKALKVRRIFDRENQTLIYVSYSTKEIEGSHKHSLSTVPLFGSKAYRAVSDKPEAN